MSASKILTLEGASSPYFSISAIWVVKFPREGYKIILMLGQKSTNSKEIKVSKSDFHSQFSKSKYISKVNFLSENIYQSFLLSH